MFIELGLDGSDGQFEIFVIEGWIDDFMAVLFEVGRFDAARNRVPSMGERGSSCQIRLGEKPVMAIASIPFVPNLDRSDSGVPESPVGPSQLAAEAPMASVSSPKLTAFSRMFSSDTAL